MKKYKVLFFLLMFLPLVAVLVALQLLPDQIPVHYGMDNQVNRWGSKYETMIFPAITVAFGAFMLIIAKYSAKQEKQRKNNEKICITIAIMCLLIFNGMTGYFLYTSFNKVENLSSVVVDIYRLVFILTGMLMILIGSIMPKMRLNSVMGLRTAWSMKNETTWKKSQQFGAIVSIVTGSLMILVCCFTKGFSCFLWSISILILSIPVDIYYTYRVAKQ